MRDLRKMLVLDLFEVFSFGLEERRLPPSFP